MVYCFKLLRIESIIQVLHFESSGISSSVEYLANGDASLKNVGKVLKFYQVYHECEQIFFHDCCQRCRLFLRAHVIKPYAIS